MDRENCGLVLILMGATVASICSADGQEGALAKTSASATKLSECVPERAYRLFSWPGPAILDGPNRVSSDAPEVAWPKKQCRAWVDKVLAPTWLPVQGAEWIFIREEFDGCDTVRITWPANGHSIQVSQTASVFAIKLTPIDQKTTGADPARKVENARRLCMRLFTQKGRRWSEDETGAPIEVEVDDLSNKIASWAFRQEHVRRLEVDDSVCGRSGTAGEAGVRESEDDHERRRERKADNPNWESSSPSWNYWFRMVHWWNDGKSIGFYFLKVEEGSWSPSYGGDNMDRRFFRVRAGRSTTTRSKD